MSKWYLVVLLFIALVVVGGFVFLGQEKQSTETRPTPIVEETPEAGLSGTPTQQSNMAKVKKPQMTIDVSKGYTAVIHTEMGDITINLHANDTPITVNNFVYLAKQGFYDDTIFHRVMKGFMIQGGDPEGTGAGGPGYQFEDEEFEGEYKRGIVAMANAGPDTNGSQFFIMHADYPLPKNYTIFGNVTEGMDIVDKIANSEVTASFGGEMSKPVKPVKVMGVEVREK